MAGISISPLFEPLQVRGATLPNRFIMGPMAKKSAGADGVPSLELGAYYGRRVHGGVGTVFTGGVFIEHQSTLGDFGMTDTGTPYMWSDAALDAWRSIVSEVHDAGGLIFPQLIHIGAMKSKGGPSFTPSGSWGPTDRPTGYSKEAVVAYSRPGHAMTETEVQDVIAAFAAAAGNAKAVGFDGIALHGGHGYLIDNFLWAETNWREDYWGGNHVERTRFAVEVVRAVRRAVGEEMPISFRFSQWKPQDFYARLAETPQQLEEILGPLVDAGVDIFEASAREFTDAAFADHPDNLACWTRKITGCPTVMIGGPGIRRVQLEAPLTPPQTVDNLDDIVRRYEHGEFDLLAVARALLNDAHWVERARAGGPFLPFDPKCLKPDYLQ